MRSARRRQSTTSTKQVSRTATGSDFRPETLRKLSPEGYSALAVAVIQEGQRRLDAAFARGAA